MREHAAHPHPDKIRILAVILNPLFELRLVRPLDGAAVDMAVVPTMAKPPEAFSEPAAVAGRISESKPDDFCPFIGQRTF